eukprot:11203069-Lingulodinium_polyedra.AAC.1
MSRAISLLSVEGLLSPVVKVPAESSHLREARQAPALPPGLSAACRCRTTAGMRAVVALWATYR